MDQVATSPITFAQESLAKCWDEGQALVAANQREAGEIQDRPFEPDRDRYFALDEHGYMRLFTMREGEKLVGYNLFAIMESMRYKGVLVATQETLYVAPEHRGKRAVEFIAFCDETLIAAGINEICRQTKAGKNDYSKLLYHLGYQFQESVFTRRVG